MTASLRTCQKRRRAPLPSRRFGFRTDASGPSRRFSLRATFRVRADVPASEQRFGSEPTFQLPSDVRVRADVSASERRFGFEPTFRLPSNLSAEAREGCALSGSLKKRDLFPAALHGRTEYGRAIAKAKPVRGAGKRKPRTGLRKATDASYNNAAAKPPTPLKQRQHKPQTQYN